MHAWIVLPIWLLLLQPGGGLPIGKPADPPPPKLEVRLLPAAESVRPGSEVELAIEFDISKPWHVYHPILLDTGLPTTLRFFGPREATVENLRWPAPTLGSVSDIEYLALEGRFTVVGTLRVSPDAAPGQVLTLVAEASALACVEACVPVEAKASLGLPVTADAGAEANRKAIDAALDRLPRRLAHAPYIKGSRIGVSKESIGLNEPAELIATIRVQSGHHVQDRDPGVEGLIASRFFVERREGVELADEREQLWPKAKTRELPGVGVVREQSGEFTVRIPLRITDGTFPAGPVELRVLFQYQACTDAGVCYPPELAEAVVRFTAETPAPRDESKALYVAADADALARLAEAPGGVSSGSSDPPAAQAVTRLSSLPLAMLLGLLGGLILNVMPCVLPVISIKIMSFVQQGGEDPRRVLRLGLTFCAGILVWFWLFALLSRAGHVPLQYPAVVIGVAAVLFVMALNLFGVFELSLPGSAAGTLDRAAQREGYPGAFLKGFLATLLGTACTAPFLAGALVYAATQPFVNAMLVFSAAGVGMAAPYLALCLNPAWMRYLPRPGPWMNTFKQSMSFILLGTVVWLLWVLDTQLGGAGVVWTVSFLAFLGLAAWMVGKVRHSWSATARRAAVAGALAVAVGGYWFSFHVMYRPAQSQRHTGLDVDGVIRFVEERGWDDGIPWAPYSPGIGEALAQRGYTAYIDFTASWCVNCQWNKKTVLELPSIRQQMERLRVVPIEADFSTRDPAMLEVLKRFGRPGVPLNLIYPAHKPAEPIVLDPLLTPGHVSSNLDRAGASTPTRVATRHAAAAQRAAAN